MKNYNDFFRKGRKVISGTFILLCIITYIVLIKKYKNVESGTYNKEVEKNINENGYNLPVDEAEKKEAEEECRKVMEMVREIYINSDKGTSINPILSSNTVQEMYNVIVADGYPVSDYENKAGMGNYEKMEQFLNDISAKEKSEIAVYEVLMNGGISRQKFIYDDKDMYLLYTSAVWDKKVLNPIMTTSFTRIKDWKYTKRGWFYYVYYVPEFPEVTEVINGDMVIRVKPFNNKYQELTDKYLIPISYQGNNLLCSNWNKEHMEKIDYTGLFEFLYMLKYKEEFPFKHFSDGIPRELFENVITEYLPVSKQQLEEYAVYNKQNATYQWDKLGCGNFSPNVFATSYPEVTEMVYNADGTLTMTVSAVSEMFGSDDVLMHEITVKLLDNGSIEYLSNKLIGEEVPPYQYRIPKYKETY